MPIPVIYPNERGLSAIETEHKEIELEQEYAVIEEFPEEAIDLEIEVDLFKDGTTTKVHSSMGTRELSEAIRETKDGYLPGIMEMSFEEADNYTPVTDCIVLSLPAEAVHVLLAGHIYRDGEPEVFEKHLDIKEIRRAFQMAEEDYIPSDAVFTITEKGKALAEKMLEGDINDEG